MKKITYLTSKWILFLGCFTLFLACEKDYEDTRVASPEMNMTELNFKDGIKVGDKIKLEAVNVVESESEPIYANEWMLDDKIVSTRSTYEFVAKKAGDYTLIYRAYNIAGDFIHIYEISVEDNTSNISIPNSENILN